jgi:hypothetical protein
VASESTPVTDSACVKGGHTAPTRESPPPPRTTRGKLTVRGVSHTPHFESCQLWGSREMVLLSVPPVRKTRPTWSVPSCWAGCTSWCSTLCSAPGENSSRALSSSSSSSSATPHAAHCTVEARERTLVAWLARCTHTHDTSHHAADPQCVFFAGAAMSAQLMFPPTLLLTPTTHACVR